MFIRPGALFAVIWIGWIVSWLAAAFWANRTEKLALRQHALLYRVAVVVGAILMTPWAACRRLPVVRAPAGAVVQESENQESGSLRDD